MKTYWAVADTSIGQRLFALAPSEEEARVEFDYWRHMYRYTLDKAWINVCENGKRVDVIEVDLSKDPTARFKLMDAADLVHQVAGLLHGQEREEAMRLLEALRDLQKKL